MKEYKVNDIFILDEEYSKRAYFCNQNGLMIVEITTENDKERKFQIKERPAIKGDELLEQEKIDLRNWFNNTYSYQEQKYRRLIALNKPDDDGVDANEKLIALYNEAEEKRKRIQELEAQLDAEEI